jgi:hypothetical protein
MNEYELVVTPYMKKTLFGKMKKRWKYQVYLVTKYSNYPIYNTYCDETNKSINGCSDRFYSEKEARYYGMKAIKDICESNRIKDMNRSLFNERKSYRTGCDG